MTEAILKRFPDNSGCQHAHLRASRISGDVEFGECLDCGHQIAFHLDKAGIRTGQTETLTVDPLPKDPEAE
jgi:hypothetical protein